MTNASKQFSHVHFVINPGAGKDEPILNTINRVLQPHDIDWTVSITNKDVPIEYDIPTSADLLAVYGGDGTVMNVVGSLIDKNLPLAILPGGTGNALAHKLGIPIELEQALQTIVGEHLQRKIDIAEIRGQDGHVNHFLLRATIGLYNEMLNSTSPDMKNRLGELAYVIGGIKSMKDRQSLMFELCIDGQTVKAEGHTCMVANVSTIGGRADVDIAPQVSPSDGLLDVFVFNTITQDILSALRSHITSDVDQFPHHWSGREISIQTEQPESIIIDGEEVCNTKAHISLLPQAVSILVPAKID